MSTTPDSKNESGNPSLELLAKIAKANRLNSLPPNQLHTNNLIAP